MFCPFCGAQTRDDAKFCLKCGKALTAPEPNAAPEPIPAPDETVRLDETVPAPEPVFEPTPAPEPAPAQYAPPQPQYAPPRYAQPQAQPQYAPIADPRRTAARSPLFFIGTLFVTLVFLIALVFATRNYVNVIDRGMRATTLYSLLMTSFNVMIATLTAVAVWLSFGLSRSKRDPLPVGGALTFVSVAVILRLVYSLVSFGRFVYDIIDTRFFNYARGKSWVYFALDVTDFLIYTVTLIVVLVALGAIKKRRAGSAVTIAGMMCIAYAAYSIAQEVFYIIDAELSYWNVWNYISLCSVVLTAVAMLLFGLLLLKYAKVAKNAQAGSVQAQYAPQYAPQAQR